MIRNRPCVLPLLVVLVLLQGCASKMAADKFDRLNRVVTLGNWQFTLNVQNLRQTQKTPQPPAGKQYLKAMLYVANTNTRKSLLYSASRDPQDYEQKYQYLSFESGKDLYLKKGEDRIYPIGYVFEPSNGLSTTDRLVYTFELPDRSYDELTRSKDPVEFWYVDKIAGVGKICFRPQ